MISYKDMTFCASDCLNKECIRFVSTEVVQGSQDTGLPLAQANFSPTCTAYKDPEPSWYEL